MNDDMKLRPLSLDDYRGQNEVKEMLSMYINASIIRQEGLDHIILYGGPGLGKTTLANIIANELELSIHTIVASSLKGPKDMLELLTGIAEPCVFFIDEIHRLHPKIEEVLYSAMEDYKITIKEYGDVVQYELPRFTLIGATTRPGMLTGPLRDRFPIQLELQPYTNTELRDIVKRSAYVMGTDIDDECADMIAVRSRGVPRLANGYLKRVRDFATILNNDNISKEVVDKTFKGLNIDSKGLNNKDRRFLDTIINRFKFGPVGIEPLCAALNDDKITLENTVEPYLVQLGFLEKTTRGRVATKLAYEFLKDNK